MIVNKSIDSGKAFDWGRTSTDYAKYRDIYPQEFYEKIVSRGLCISGQNILDIGTGTGVLPRNMYHYGADWTAADISENQIAEAIRLSRERQMNIKYIVSSTEQLSFADESFDVITACQCFWYFDHKTIAPKLYNMLKRKGRLLVLYMAWLPYEDKIAGESEKLVLKYSPNWSGAGETIKPIGIPKCIYDYFNMVYHEEYRIKLPFTKETWNGRMKACRGVGASLNSQELANWEREHLSLLNSIAQNEFEILHYCAMAELEVKK